MPLRARSSSSLIASAQPLNINNTQQLINRQLLRQPWQQRAWLYYRVSGPLHFAGRYVGNALSKIQLLGAEEDNDDADTDPQPTDQPAIKEAIQNLKSKRGGQAALLRNLGTNLFVTGEVNLAGWEDDELGRQVWEALSIDELIARPGDRRFGRRLGPGMVEEWLPADALITRMWSESPQYSGLADTSVMTILDEAELLFLMTLAEKAVARSRLANSGLLLFPSQLLLPGRASDDVRRGQGQLVQGVDAEPTMEAITSAMTAALQQEGHPSEVVPIMLTGDGDVLEKVRHLVLERKQDMRYKERRDTALAAMATGLDLPPEVLLGTSHVSHWGAWQIEEQTFKAHIQPFIELVCDALTVGYLQPAAKKAKVPDFEKYVVWYDAAKLIVKPDRSNDAKELHDRIVISDSTLRRENDFSDDDAPDEEEYKRRVGLKLQDLPTALGQEAPPPGAPAPGAPTGDGVPGPDTLGPPPLPQVDPENAAAVRPGPPQTANRPNPAATATPAAPVQASAAPPRLSRLGNRLARLDQDLMQRLRVAGDAAVQRALERAGAKIRTKARHDDFSILLSDGVPNEELAAHMGREQVRALGFAVDDELDLPDDNLEDNGDNDLVAPALIAYRDRAGKWITDAQDAALRDVAYSIADERGDDADQLYSDLKDQVGPRLNAAKVAGTAALAASALAFTRRKLFDTNAGANTVGEFDDVRIPAGLVREALRIAGGAGEEAAEVGGGVGTGTIVTDVLGDQGVQTSGMTWDYGPAVRNSFEPHLDLDGLSFTDWSDDALTVQPGDEWLDSDYYHPGDHNGCLCTVIPSFSLTSGE